MAPKPPADHVDKVELFSKEKVALKTNPFESGKIIKKTLKSHSIYEKKPKK